MNKILLILVFALFNSCSPRESGAPEAARTPSQSLEGFFGMALLPFEYLAEGASELVRIPMEWLENTIIVAVVKKEVKALPLKEDVRKRILARIDSEDFLAEIVPFIFNVKNLYFVEDPLFEENPFEAYVTQLYADKKIPGLEHDLFSFKKESEGETTPQGPTDADFKAKVFAGVLNIYDAIFLQGPQREFGERIEVDQALVARTSPQVRAVLEMAYDQLKGSSQGGGVEGEIPEVLEYILNEPGKVKILTTSLADFITQMIYENYQMFYLKTLRARKLNEMLQREVDSIGSANRASRLSTLMILDSKKRYGVHITVDGLQGKLMEALTSTSHQHPFLQQVYADHLKLQELKIPGRDVQYLKPMNRKFLQYIAQNDYADTDYLRFFFQKIYSYQSTSAWSKGGISTTPTISVRNLPIAFNGVPVASTLKDGKMMASGIPNFHFVERTERPEGRAYYFFGNDALLLEKIAQKNGMKTIFQQLIRYNSLNCFSNYSKGAYTTLNSFINLGLGESIRDLGEKLCLVELKKRFQRQKELEEMKADIIDYVEEMESAWFGITRSYLRSKLREKVRAFAEAYDEGVPQFFFYYNPWPDHFAHPKGPFSDEVISPTGELNRLSFYLTIIENMYRQAGLWDRTLFGINGDHGLSPAYILINPEVEVFENLKEKEGIEFKFKRISSLEGEGPKLNDRFHPESNKGYDAIVASTAGGNYMFDFFNSQDDRRWQKQPCAFQLTNYKTLSGKKVDVIKSMLHYLQDSLDYLVVRDCFKDNAPHDFSRGRVKVMGVRQGKKEEVTLIRRGQRIFYRYEAPPLSGKLSLQEMDPLLDLTVRNPYATEEDFDQKRHQELLKKCLVEPKFNDETTWCEEEEWRELASFTPRPDSVVQLAHLYDLDLAGTVNLFPKLGIGYNSTVPGRHAGEHFHEKDAAVAFWGGPLKRNTQRETIKHPVIGSVAPTLYEWLTGRPVIPHAAGFGYPSLLPQLLGDPTETR